VLASGVENWGSISLARAAGTGILTGVIYRGSDTSARLAGATVTLSTGQTATSDASGVYRFAAVAEGAVTITASKAGFTTRSITRTIARAVENWGSIGLASGSALVDECADLPTTGACDGAIVSHCDGGRLVQVDLRGLGPDLRRVGRGLRRLRVASPHARSKIRTSPRASWWMVTEPSAPSGDATSRSLPRRSSSGTWICS
jgi:hypothetical protein